MPHGLPFTADARMELLDESAEAFMAISRSWFDGLDVAQIPDTFPKVLEGLRQQGLLAEAPHNPHQDLPFDITREPLIFPVPRSAALATMTRSEQVLCWRWHTRTCAAMGISIQTVAELRVGFVPVMLPHPIQRKADGDW